MYTVSMKWQKMHPHQPQEEILNKLIDALNQKQHQCLPRFLIITLDKDLIEDLNSLDFGATKNMAVLVNWLT